jgi:hypothetical protein
VSQRPEHNLEAGLAAEQISDDTDRGWGEDRDAVTAEEAEAADVERLRQEKPPHW